MLCLAALEPRGRETNCRKYGTNTKTGLVSVLLDDNRSLQIWPFGYRWQSCTRYGLWSLFCFYQFCGNKFYCNDIRIPESKISDKTFQSTVYILLYKLIMEWLWPGRGGWELIDSRDADTFVCRLNTGREIATKTVGWPMCILLITYGLFQICTESKIVTQSNTYKDRV